MSLKTHISPEQKERMFYKAVEKNGRIFHLKERDLHNKIANDIHALIVDSSFVIWDNLLVFWYNSEDTSTHSIVEKLERPVLVSQVEN